MDGAKLTELVPPGTIEKPSGMALDGDTLYVTDNASGLIYVLDVTGKQQRVINSGLAAGALAGITVGPDEKLYITNLSDGTVSRVEVP
jgi:DNA-binding beta-propeller fold protein YncE